MRYRSAYLLVLGASLLVAPADADIAPNPMTGGRSLTSYSGEIDDIRMVEEDVYVRVFENRIETVAEFLMLNEGESTSIEVGFPYGYPDEFTAFRVFVDGNEVRDIRDAVKEQVIRGKRSTTKWKLWTVTFEGGETYCIRIEYSTRCWIRSHVPLADSRFSSLPPEILEELHDYTTVGSAEYILWTGKAWSGVVDKCRVTIKLEERPVDRIQRFWPNDGRLTDDGVVWEYTAYEPIGQVGMSYYPNMPARDIPPYLLGICERYAKDPRVADAIGSILSMHFGEKELSKRVYHEFLAGWDEPIPDLLRRGPDGRCGYDWERAGRFYSAWRIASILFGQYKRDREIEKARDIAPTAAKMSRAIIEALQSCDTLGDQDRYLLRDATALYELSMGLIEDRSGRDDSPK